MKLPRFGKNAVIITLVVVLITVGALGVNLVLRKNSAIKQLKQQNKQLTATIEEFRQNNEQLINENEQLKEKSGQNNAVINEQQAKINDLQAQLDKAKASIKQNAAKKAAANPATPQDVGVPVTGTGRICYLTFDDGPSSSTPRLLDMLDYCQVRATFFVVNTAYLDDYLDDIYARGHAIGLHCNSHEWSKVYASPDAYYNDLEMINNAVRSYIGVGSKILRFPGGSSNTVSKNYCPGIMSVITQGVQERGYYYFDWNVSSGDADGVKHTAQQIADRVVRSAQNKNEICVLMHDASSKKSTVDALPMMVKGLRELGFEFKVLSPSSNGFHMKVAN